VLYTITVKLCLVKSIVKWSVFLASITISNLISGLFASAVPDNTRRVLVLLNNIIGCSAVNIKMTGDLNVSVHAYILHQLYEHCKKIKIFVEKV
jgi:hypothetical protein